MPALAIRGGEPLVREPLPRWPTWGEEEERLLLRALRSGEWDRHGAGQRRRHGPARTAVAELEALLSEVLRAPHVVAVSSATAGLEVVLRAIGLRPGDEVIVPAYGVICTASPVVVAGGTPVFADVQEGGCNVDPAAVERLVTRRTRAIIAVHFGGVPCDLDALGAIARAHGAYLLEDAAHGHGGEWKGQPLGSLGDAGVLSFHASKNVACGEGGAVVTRDRGLADAVRAIHDNGRKRGGEWYDYSHVGINARMSSFQAAVVAAQLQRMPSQLEERVASVRRFLARLAEVPGLAPVAVPPGASRCGHHLVVLLHRAQAWDGLPRHRLLLAAQAEGLPCTAGYPLPLDQVEVLRRHARGSPGPCERAERLCRREAVWLDQALFLGGGALAERYAAVFEKIHAHRDELRR